MSHDKDANTCFESSVDNRVRKDSQRKSSAPSFGWYAEAWVLDQEVGGALELAVETLRYNWTGALRVEVQYVSDVLLGAGV